MAQETEERLVSVTIISTESDILREIDFAANAIIKDCCGDRESCLAFECRLCWTL